MPLGTVKGFWTSEGAILTGYHDAWWQRAAAARGMLREIDLQLRMRLQFILGFAEFV
jgi:hypothetical protein